MFNFYGGKVLRYIAAVFGGYMLAKGDMSVDDLNTFMGAVSSVGAAVVSAWLSHRRIKAGKQDV